MKSGVLRLFPLLLAMLSTNKADGGTNNAKPLLGRTAGWGGYGQYYGKSSGRHKKHRNRLLMVKRIKTKHRKSFVK